MLESNTIYGFFDGDEQDGNCGTGMILHIDDSHSFKIRMGVGSGTDTFSELLAFWGLLWFAKIKKYSPAFYFWRLKGRN